MSNSCKSALWSMCRPDTGAVWTPSSLVRLRFLRRGFGGMHRVLLGTVVALMVAVATFAASASAGSSSAQAAQAAFRHWLNGRFGQLHGYSTCPPGQAVGGSMFYCQAEFRLNRAWHLVLADVNISNGAPAITHPRTMRWMRRWSRYSSHFPAVFSAPGVASVNGPAYDWAWIVSGAYNIGWQRHRSSFTDIGYDGSSTGLLRFYRFQCHVRGPLIYCANAFGDAIRYKP
jgi:hypothetical protein